MSASTIESALLKFKSSIPSYVDLVAVSKTKPNEDILLAYNAGQRIFGENKIQEMASKYNEMPKDIAWHMIGHIQRNKVKYMASFVSLIHGVDSLRLLTEINKQALKNNRIIDCLLQVKKATEENKFGLSENEVLNLLASEEIKNFQNIKIVGLMGMATFTDNQEQLQKEFQMLKSVFDNLTHRKSSNFNLKTLSMGMSDDYPIAIKNGSTMIRVGSSIFGKRTLA